jgi:hypothetical protein
VSQSGAAFAELLCIAVQHLHDNAGSQLVCRQVMKAYGPVASCLCKQTHFVEQHSLASLRFQLALLALGAQLQLIPARRCAAMDTGLPAALALQVLLAWHCTARAPAASMQGVQQHHAGHTWELTMTSGF